VDAETLTLTTFCERIINGPTGLKSFEEHEVAQLHSDDRVAGAIWAVRCLTNPKLEDSGTVLQKIMAERLKETVNHPPHYNAHPSGVEAVEIIERLHFCMGEAVKYVWRAGLKVDAVDDLKKAAWYLRRIGTHGNHDWTRPSRELLDKVLAAEPRDGVLGSVLRALFLNDGASYFGAISGALWIVEAEIERRQPLVSEDRRSGSERRQAPTKEQP